MHNAVFIINDRFVINVDRNKLYDKATGEEYRLEPRLMKLLLLLKLQQGNVVKREFIINEIWDNYPGANEGLSQAISYLRKILFDEHKTIIQTQPKVGYSFHAVISQNIEQKLMLRKKHLRAIVGISFFALLLFFAFRSYINRHVPSVTSNQLHKNDDVKIAEHDSANQAGHIKRLLKDTLGDAAKGDSLRSN